VQGTTVATSGTGTITQGGVVSTGFTGKDS